MTHSADKIVNVGRKSLRVLGWTPSRFAKWKECPQKVLLEDLMKMCPVCFMGRVSGGYDGEPVVCDTCDKDQPIREAMDRGNRLDAALTSDVGDSPVQGVVAAAKVEGATQEVLEAAQQEHEETLAEAQRHPKIRAMVQKLKKTKGVSTQESIVLDANWNPVSKFTKNAWARLKLDVLIVRAKVLDVLDWKSGNIDKRTGEIRERPEYHDSMRAYQMAVLSAYPQAEASATMVFLDAPPKLVDPTKSLPVLKRKDLKAAKLEWEAKISPMLADTQFPPRPGMGCNWCPFQKAKGGPCRF